ncbi:MAG: hypothetical protein PVH88_22540 [Ignavibacteria bacterium]|jgi:hypothetical protein
MKKIIRFLLVVFYFSGVIYAQLPHTFTNTAHNTHYGNAWDVAVSSDGTVFLANSNGGLRAYTYDGTSFTNNCAHK